MRNILVLDVGGVLATNLTPRLWQDLADLSNTSIDTMYASYKQEISKQLWTGQCTEKQFWQWLASYGVQLSVSDQRRLITQALQPLPALDYLERWSKLADIYIMSNHLNDWLQPLLAPYLPYIKSIHVSDQVRLSKPNPKWFQLLHEQFTDVSSIWFVDDSSNNIAVAQTIGWNVLLADQNHDWIATLTEQLQSTSNN
ncbi:MAG: haloacid dehalogenase [Candidatus Pristimantibacillus lignocellulolyticus]|uniref:Haloacid dehalogenase n=1 Tax=Candidatus Pristimantibacillus lignocellulolyticus TaxID=2994561 RepID=A0A9J6ZBQ5_9BACL|nr:MAG: haloacid dehalogenase [Candidatus Pristimantibacillus lignocellulolyticus]